MSTLHDLPKEERPRERLIKHGAEALSLQELLALIFGRGIKGEPVMKISQQLLSKFGSLQVLSETSIEDLRTIKGLGLAKACQLKACFELSRRLNSQVVVNKNKEKLTISPNNIYQQIRSKIINYHKEHLLVISLDNRNKIIGFDTVSIGTLNSNLIHPRETFEAAIKRHAAQIILCHNHPSGELIPSKDDLIVTKNLISAGKLLDIEVIDHLIITKEGFYSFTKENVIF
ncbi:MAG: DNA repair protein RadC [Candidatus Roizmanbacteria bacterium]